MLNFDQLKKYLESIQKNKLIVAFFINNAEVSQDEWMNPFAEILKNHDYFTIGIVTPYANQTAMLDITDISALIEANYIKDLPNIDIKHIEQEIEIYEKQLKTCSNYLLFNKLMNHYEKAVEYYSAINDLRYEIYTNKIQVLFSNENGELIEMITFSLTTFGFGERK